MVIDNQILYLDSAASAKPYKEAMDLAYKVSLETYANPNSIHSLGTKAEEYLNKSRKQILKFVVGNEDSKNPFECIFTSGATESNNLAIIGASYAKKGFSKRIITTSIEHDSVSKVFAKLENEGFQVEKISIDKDGTIDFDKYIEMLKAGVGFVSFIYCCNQNGMLLPIDELAKITKKYSPRTIFHTDATQAIGKIDLNLDNVDLVSFSGHKIGAMRGSGALLKRKNTSLIPPEVGGGQEQNLRPGTSNTPGAVSMAIAIKLDYQTMNQQYENTLMINQYIREKMKGVDGIIVMSPKTNYLPYVLTFGLKYHKASVMAEYLSKNHIYVSTTSACDDRLTEPNMILRSLGYERHCADNPIRLSFCGIETKKQMDEFIHWFKEGLKTLSKD